MTKKTKKKINACILGTEEPYILEFETEKECDDFMRKATVKDIGKEHIGCSHGCRTTKPENRIIAKLEGNATELDNVDFSYLFFCSQKCYDDFFNVKRPTKKELYHASDDQLWNEQVWQFKDSIIEVFKP